jgi:hypothetical protein
MQTNFTTEQLADPDVAARSIVIPAKAGIHGGARDNRPVSPRRWAPAVAGVTCYFCGPH